MDINLTIANNIRAAREQRKLTLDAAATTTGVSRSMLAQIERSDVNPTISTLWKIANGYKVSFTSLVEKPDDGDEFVPCPEPITEDGSVNYYNYPTFPFDDQKHFEMYRIIIDNGGHLEAEPHLALSEEYITVFAGKVEVVLENKSFILGVGDSVKFKADQRHEYKNVGNSKAEMSMLIYYGE